MRLGTAFCYATQRFPDKTAIISGEGRWTYRELDARVTRLAGALWERGLRTDDRVAVLGRNSHRYLELSIALARIGAWMVPINHRLLVDQIAMRLRHSDAQAVVMDEAFLPMVDKLEPDLRQRLRHNVIVLGERGVGGADSYEDLIRGGAPEPPIVDLSPEHPLYLGYTSGTTGRSKAAIVSHRAIVAGFLYKTLDFGLCAEDVALNPGYFWHSAPRDFALLQLYLGGTTIVTPEFDAETCLRLIEEHRVTNGFFVPTMFRMILDLPNHRDYDVSSMRVLMSGGAPLPTGLKDEVVERFGSALHEFYAATETRIVTTVTAEELATRRRTVGRPVRDIQVRILDEDGEPVPVGEVGEIYLQSPTLFSGYYKDEEKTRAVFRGNWFSLGDMGRLDDDGYLYIVDRKQDMVISGGENIYPSEVEDVLVQHPAVSDAAVIGVPDPRWGEALKAVVCLLPGSQASEEDLKQYCAERLADYLKPRSVDFVEELPRNPTGKVLKRELRERYWNDGDVRV